ncbi:hypothetical protein N836_11100 [Leptolyngbya sp. Heron Island J]|nr:hypothetical protein N836_11100 [Leptolyngbya sp. Heron Island J]
MFGSYKILIPKGIRNTKQAKRKNKLPKRLNTSPALILAAPKKLADRMNKAHPKS